MQENPHERRTSGSLRQEHRPATGHRARSGRSSDRCGGGVAVATALAVQGGAAAESAVATTATERAVLAGVRAATVGVEPTVGAATVEAAVPVGASTGAAAPVVAGATFVLPAVITGYHWYRWKTFQEKWIAAGYVLLEDPLRICTGGCHLPSVPKRPTDLPEFPPVEPVGPFPFHPPRQPLPPEWTELKPFEAKRAAPRAIPTPGPSPCRNRIPAPRTAAAAGAASLTWNCLKARQCIPNGTAQFSLPVWRRLRRRS